MNYKGFDDLSRDIKKNLYKIPSDISLVVGIPRSGLLPANLISLFLNRPLTDLDNFLKGSIISSGERGEMHDKDAFTGKILIVDDSIHSGKALSKAKAKIKTLEKQFDIVYCAVYALPGSEHLVDIHFESVEEPRVFEWNIFHHAVLKNACVDIDGVLCIDPLDSENDDGDCYINFLGAAKAKILPKVKIGTLVTSRLEKYRSHTEDWLRKNNIKYDELIMMDVPDKATRLKLSNHGEFKASEYKKKKNAYLFIESNAGQAQKIFEITGKDVYCVDTNEMLSRNSVNFSILKSRLSRKYKFLKYKIKQIIK
ncbi:MAG: phosphoribosyl transferase [Nitrosopumilus sp.]|nr:phosphoribosyl transferase [Nitrosopumilus sp.]